MCCAVLHPATQIGYLPVPLPLPHAAVRRTLAGHLSASTFMTLVWMLPAGASVLKRLSS